MRKFLYPMLVLSITNMAFAAEYGGKTPIVSDKLEVDGGRFNIEFVNERGHVCSAQGKMDKDLVWKGEEGCRIRFGFKGDKAEVDADGCKIYCGEGADFPSVYYKLPQICTKSGVKQMEKSFQTALKTGKNSQAIQLKQDYLKQCGEFLNPTETLAAANDAAGVYLKQNDKAACNKVLDAVRDSYEAPILGRDLSDRHNAEIGRAEKLKKQCGGQAG